MSNYSIVNNIFANKFVTNLALNIQKVITFLLSLTVLVVCSQISIYTPFSPVPFTMQTFAVFVILGSTGWKNSVLTTTSFLTLGVIGAPIFANFKSGLLPSTGYIFGFILASIFVGWFSKQIKPNTIIRQLSMLLISNVIIYISGLIFLGIYMSTLDIVKLLTIGVVPFVIVDLIKIALSSIILGQTAKKTDKNN